jgi:hypothetical protein
MKKSFYIYTMLIAFCLISLITNINSYSKNKENTKTLTTTEMTAGQLLDEQLALEQEISKKIKEKNLIQQLRDEKTASARGQDIT